MAIFSLKIVFWVPCRSVRRKSEITHVSLLMTSNKKSNSATTHMRLLTKTRTRSDHVKTSMRATAPMTRKIFFKSHIRGRCFLFNSFKYTPSTSWFGLSTTGQVSVYDQGGFTMTFGSSSTEFAAEISQLYQGYV